MFDDLVLDYGLLHPLSAEELRDLNRSLSDFEEETGYELAPYILTAGFLETLRFRAGDWAGTGDDFNLWQTLWGIVCDGSILIGFLFFSGPPNARGAVGLSWSINAEWIDSPLFESAVKGCRNWAFGNDECRRMEIESEVADPDLPASMLRRCGFAMESRTEPQHWAATKAVEGRLL